MQNRLEAAIDRLEGLTDGPPRCIQVSRHPLLRLPPWRWHKIKLNAALDRQRQHQGIGAFRKTSQHRHHRVGENEAPTHQLTVLRITRAGNGDVEVDGGTILGLFDLSIDRVGT